MKNDILSNFNIKIVKNARSKNIKLRVDKTGAIIVTMPKWTLKRTALAFVQENIDWITEQLSNCPASKFFVNGLKLSVLGQDLTICHMPSDKNGTRIENNLLIVGGNTAHLHRRIRDFIKKQAYAHIQQKAIGMASQLGEKPAGITLKDTSSRWGSCSSAKHLNFCWKLALAPTFVLDYIVAHEVSHLKQMNHSDKFWAVVASLGVHRADAEIWLRKNGSDLQMWE